MTTVGTGALQVTIPGLVMRLVRGMTTRTDPMAVLDRDRMPAGRIRLVRQIRACRVAPCRNRRSRTQVFPDWRC